MKTNSILIILFITCINVIAQDHYLYELYDDRFQAVFPGNPSIELISKELLDPRKIEELIPYEYKKELTKKQIKEIVSNIIIKNDIEMYKYIDSSNQIVYISQYAPFPSKNDVREYTKNTLDEMVIVGIKGEDLKLINFSSMLNKKQNIYIAIYTVSFFIEGQKMYASTKYIGYKNKIYKWSVLYSTLNDKHIFDDYKDQCKVIR